MKMLLLISCWFCLFNPSANILNSTTTIEIPTTTEYIEFTLRNNSLKSIPLLIPKVMNPNLSPMSNSGVRLKVGQNVLFRYKGKKQILLEVHPDLEGKTLDVAKLLKERKKEIDQSTRK